MDIAVVGVGVNLGLDDGGVCRVARVSLGAAAPTALLVKEAAGTLIGTRVDGTAVDRLAEATSSACQPIDDKRGSREYRVKMARVLARRVAYQALERARQN
jgi:carbon-monoxide dehydrogenase medium subunit